MSLPTPDPRPPMVAALGWVSIATVANAAAALPGWRAGRIRPAEALHAE